MDSKLYNALTDEEKQEYDFKFKKVILKTNFTVTLLIISIITIMSLSITFLYNTPEMHEDKVVTAGGIRGNVKHVKENTVTIKVDSNTTIEFNKSAVTNILDRKESRESAEETKE